MCQNRRIVTSVRLEFRSNEAGDGVTPYRGLVIAALLASLAAVVDSSAQETAVPVLQTGTSVSATALSPDGKTLAILDDLGRDLSVWELDTGRKILLLRASEVPIQNSRALVGGPGYTVSVSGPNQGDRVVFAPDGQYLAAFRLLPDPNSPPVVWDLTTGRVVGPWRRDAARALTLAETSWTPDTIRSWNSGGPTSVLHVDSLGLPVQPLIEAAALSPDGSRLAVARGPLTNGDFAKPDSSVELWPLTSPGGPRFLAESLFAVDDLSFSHDSQWLAAATLTNDITGRYTRVFAGDAHAWRLDGSKELALDIPGAIAGEWSASHIAFSPDDKQVVSTVLVNGKAPRRSDCSAGEPCGDPESVMYDVRAAFFDLSTGRAVASSLVDHVDSADRDSAGLLWLSPDGRRALVRGKSLGSTDTLNGRHLTAFRPSQDAPLPGDTAMDCDVDLHARGFAAFRQDMAQIATADGSSLALLDSKTGATVRSTSLDDDPNMAPLAGAFSPDGTLLAVSSCPQYARDSTVRILEASTLRLRSTIHVDRAVNALAFGRDGKLLFTGGYDGVLRLWNTSDGSLAATLERSDKEWVVFAPNGLFDASVKGASLLAWRFHARSVTAGEVPELKRSGLLAELASGRQPAPPIPLEAALARALARSR